MDTGSSPSSLNQHTGDKDSWSDVQPYYRHDEALWARVSERGCIANAKWSRLAEVTTII